MLKIILADHDIKDPWIPGKVTNFMIYIKKGDKSAAMVTTEDGHDYWHGLDEFHLSRLEYYQLGVRIEMLRVADFEDYKAQIFAYDEEDDAIEGEFHKNNAVIKFKFMLGMSPPRLYLPDDLPSDVDLGKLTQHVQSIAIFMMGP